MPCSAPRNCLLNPNEFGKVPDTKWKDSVLSADLAAAETQHRFSLSARHQIKKRYGSLRNYCKETGQSYQRIGRVLRGEIKLTVTDIAFASDALGVNVAVIGAPSKSTKNGAPLEDLRLSSARDALGTFYTPNDISSKLVSCLSLPSNAKVLEPSFGDGSFLKGVKANGITLGNVYGCEIDPIACNDAMQASLIQPENVFEGSFFDFKTTKKFDAAIGNPPFVRIRSLSRNEAAAALDLANRSLTTPIGEEASEWLPFLIRASEYVKDGGSLAFVLPQDVTYLRYAKPAWKYLAENYGQILLIRIQERIFKDILQDVVILIATDKGLSTDNVIFACYRRISDFLNGNLNIKSQIKIDDILGNKRPFQRALINPSLLEELESSPLFVRAEEEALFHIGYVCGNKKFFHPSSTTVSDYCLPKKSLTPTVASSRQLAKVGFNTSKFKAPERLWLPSPQLCDGERNYIIHGESHNVHNGYKCSKRKPWWIVPGVVTPDAILSVFGDTPRLILNDGCWSISNSLLGAYCKNGTDPAAFCGTWYSSVTRLSIELQIHSLGGGVLVAVPQEANQILKLSKHHSDTTLNSRLAKSVNLGDLSSAYKTYDELLEKSLGREVIEDIRLAIDELVAWRKN